MKALRATIYVLVWAACACIWHWAWSAAGHPDTGTISETMQCFAIGGLIYEVVCLKKENERNKR